MLNYGQELTKNPLSDDEGLHPHAVGVSEDLFQLLCIARFHRVVIRLYARDVFRLGNGLATVRRESG